MRAQMKKEMVLPHAVNAPQRQPETKVAFNYVETFPKIKKGVAVKV